MRVSQKNDFHYSFHYFFLVNLWTRLCFLFFKSVFPKDKSCLCTFNHILIFGFLFTFSYSLLIILNKSGLFNIIPPHEDENRAKFSNRVHCFRYLNRLNPSFTVLNLTFILNGLFDLLTYVML